MTETLIVAGARTPFAVWKKGTRGDGTEGGRLSERDPYDLAAAAVKGAMAKIDVGPEKIDPKNDAIAIGTAKLMITARRSLKKSSRSLRIIARKGVISRAGSFPSA